MRRLYKRLLEDRESSEETEGLINIEKDISEYNVDHHISHHGLLESYQATTTESDPEICNTNNVLKEIQKISKENNDKSAEDISPLIGLGRTTVLNSTTEMEFTESNFDCTHFISTVNDKSAGKVNLGNKCDDSENKNEQLELHFRSSPIISYGRTMLDIENKSNETFSVDGKRTTETELTESDENDTHVISTTIAEIHEEPLSGKTVVVETKSPVLVPKLQKIRSAEDFSGLTRNCILVDKAQDKNDSVTMDDVEMTNENKKQDTIIDHTDIILDREVENILQNAKAVTLEPINEANRDSEKSRESSEDSEDLFAFLIDYNAGTGTVNDKSAGKVNLGNKCDDSENKNEQLELHFRSSPIISYGRTMLDIENKSNETELTELDMDLTNVISTTENESKLIVSHNTSKSIETKDGQSKQEFEKKSSVDFASITFSVDGKRTTETELTESDENDTHVISTTIAEIHEEPLSGKTVVVETKSPVLVPKLQKIRSAEDFSGLTRNCILVDKAQDKNDSVTMDDVEMTSENKKQDTIIDHTDIILDREVENILQNAKAVTLEPINEANRDSEKSRESSEDSEDLFAFLIDYNAGTGTVNDKSAGKVNLGNKCDDSENKNEQLELHFRSSPIISYGRTMLDIENKSNETELTEFDMDLTNVISTTENESKLIVSHNTSKSIETKDGQSKQEFEKKSSVDFASNTFSVDGKRTTETELTESDENDTHVLEKGRPNK